MQHCVLGKRKTYKTKKITEGDKKCDSTLKPMRINFHYIRHAISLHRHCPEHEQQTHLCLPCMQPQLKKKKNSPLAANSIFNYTAQRIDSASQRPGNPIECSIAIAPSGFNCRASIKLYQL